MIKLPEPVGYNKITRCGSGEVHVEQTDLYTADQLKQAIRDALTEAERICDHYATALDGGANEYTRSRECMHAANAIRKLKEGIQ